MAGVMTRHTLYDMIWSEHLVDEWPDGTGLLYVDRHIVHEVDSPQAFANLRRAGRAVRAPEKTLLVVDHNVPTSDRTKPNPDAESAAQIACFVVRRSMQTHGLDMPICSNAARSPARSRMLF